jgi:hypothetical protein
VLLIDFTNHVVASDRNRRLMARIALNAVGFAQRYPVDLAEFRLLSEHNRAVVNAFLDWAWTSDAPAPRGLAWLGELRAIAEEEAVMVSSNLAA